MQDRVELAGILGALLAIPVAGIIQVVLRDLWDHRRGRPKDEPTIGEDHTPVDHADDPADGGEAHPRPVGGVNNGAHTEVHGRP